MAEHKEDLIMRSSAANARRKAREQVKSYQKSNYDGNQAANE